MQPEGMLAKYLGAKETMRVGPLAGEEQLVLYVTHSQHP